MLYLAMILRIISNFFLGLKSSSSDKKFQVLKMIENFRKITIK